MATKTSVGSGLWSVAGTWDAGVPADGDTVVVAAGHTVEFNVDQSAFTGINGITDNGTLKLTRASGSYCLKMKTNTYIGGAGTFDCGTQADPIPATTKHLITGGDGWYIKGDVGAGLTVTACGVNPTYRYAKLTGVENAGSTVLDIDTDVMGDRWATGNTIYISAPTGAWNWEQRVIAAGGISSTAITVTAGLTSAKPSGSYVFIEERNVKFVGDQSYGVFISFNKNVLNLNLRNVLVRGKYPIGNSSLFAYDCLFMSGDRVLSNPGGSSFSGCIFTGSTSNVYILNPDNCDFTDCLFIGTQGPVGKFMTLKNCVLGGATYGMNGGIARLYGCAINCNTGVTSASLEIIDSTINIVYQSQFTAHNSTLTSVSSYINVNDDYYSESFDDGGVAGAYRAWTQGGVTTKQAVTYPSGKAFSMQTVLESAINYGYYQRIVTVLPGRKAKITAYLRKSTSMSYLPRCVIHNKALTDPFMGGTPIHAFTMTDSVNTWESESYEYENTGSDPVELVIRCQGMNGSGNLFSLVEIEDTTGGGGGGGGAVRILPLSGSVRL